MYDDISSYLLKKKIDFEIWRELTKYIRHSLIFHIHTHTHKRQCYKFCLNIHLRRYVIGRATKGFGSFIAGNAFLAHAKVSNLYMAVLIQQNVIELEITVDDAARVQEEQADRYLSRIESANVKRDT